MKNKITMFLVNGLKEGLASLDNPDSYIDAIDLDLDEKQELLYGTNLVCFQCGIDCDFEMNTMLSGDNIQDGLCADCREALEKIKATKYECDGCGEEYYGASRLGLVYTSGDFEEPPHYEEVDEDTVFCSFECATEYYDH